jgi:hypothetical protein
MVLLRDPIHAKMHFRAAGHPDGHFLAEEKVPMLAECLRGFDGVVVSYRDDGHPPLFAALVDVLGLIVRFAADPCETRRVAHAGASGMHVKVAAHVKRLVKTYEQTMKSGRNVSEK